MATHVLEKDILSKKAPEWGSHKWRIEPQWGVKLQSVEGCLRGLGLCPGSSPAPLPHEAGLCSWLCWEVGLVACAAALWVVDAAVTRGQSQLLLLLSPLVSP